MITFLIVVALFAIWPLGEWAAGAVASLAGGAE